MVLVRLSLLALLLTIPLTAGEWTVNSNFPGGSALVESLNPERGLLRIVPKQNARLGWRSWWYLHVSGVTPGTEVRLEVNGDLWSKPDRAWYSLDNQHWAPVESGEFAWRYRRYRQEVDGGEIWFATAPPYLGSHLQALIRTLEDGKAGVKIGELCTTREGLVVPILVFPCLGPESSGKIYVTARQHATEVGSSWVAHGLAEWLGSTLPDALALRQRAEVCLIPIMDLESVERGTGGKKQQPHDHNRDWTEKPYWESVTALMALLKADHREGDLRLFVDIHGSGSGDRDLYFHISGNSLLTTEQRAARNRFLREAKGVMTGPLIFRGRTAMTNASYDPAYRTTAHNWANLNLGPTAMAICLEVPWNTPDCTSENHRLTGVQLGETILRYLGSK